MLPTPTRPRWSTGKLLAVAILLLVLLVAFDAYVLVILPQPEISLAKEGFGTMGCAAVGGTGKWTFRFTFLLVNSGGADGVAVVGFFYGGPYRAVSAATQSYLVPHGGQAHEQYNLTAPDCASYEPDLSILSVTKA